MDGGYHNISAFSSKSEGIKRVDCTFIWIQFLSRTKVGFIFFLQGVFWLTRAVLMRQEMCLPRSERLQQISVMCG